MNHANDPKHAVWESSDNAIARLLYVLTLSAPVGFIALGVAIGYVIWG